MTDREGDSLLLELERIFVGEFFVSAPDLILRSEDFNAAWGRVTMSDPYKKLKAYFREGASERKAKNMMRSVRLQIFYSVFLALERDRDKLIFEAMSEKKRIARAQKAKAPTTVGTGLG